MKRNFYIGVDGGATKCIVRLEDEQGTLLGREVGGPATLRLPAADVWYVIHSTLDKILKHYSLSLANHQDNFHIGIGLAGSENTAVYHDFITCPHSFHVCKVVSDAHTACLGAHLAADGAIVIAGTGVVGYQLHEGVNTKIGGFGFPHDDDGGGAWVGLQAIKKTVQWLDGRTKESGVVRDVYRHFNNNTGELVAWANGANATHFATLAPIVIEQAAQKDEVACGILQSAANAIEEIANALQAKQASTATSLPCALIGGIANFLTPYLSHKLRTRLVKVSAPPDAGAIMLVRNTHAIL